MAVIVVPVLWVTSSGSEDSWSCSVSASPDSTLCFTLPPAGHVEPVSSDSVFSAAVRCNQSELYNTEKKVLFATCAAPVPRYTRHDLLSLETAATPPPSVLSPQLIARLSHLGIARNVPRKPRRSTRGGKNEWRKIKVIVGFHDRLPSIILPALQPPVVSLPSLIFTISVQLFSLTLTSVNTTPASPPNTLLVCRFNAKTVGTSRRRSDISTFIQDNNIDLKNIF